jgi:hypothetical protein
MLVSLKWPRSTQRFVCSIESETGLARTITGDATEGSAIADSTAATAGPKIGRRSGGRGGGR